MAKPEYKTVQDLRRKKIGVTGLAGTSHVALSWALEKSGLGPKEYAAVSVPGGNLVQSLDSGFVNAAALNPPTMFFAQRRGFHRLLDIGSMVEMASGGLTALTGRFRSRPDEVRRVIRALQLGKRIDAQSSRKTLALITGVLKMDKKNGCGGLSSR